MVILHLSCLGTTKLFKTVADIFHSHNQYTRVSTDYLHQHLLFGAALCFRQDLGFPNQGSNLGSPVVKVQSLSHWTNREVILLFLFLLFCFYYSYSCGCEVIFNCGFNLHFPEDYTLAAFKILSSVLTVQLCLVDLLSLYCLDLLSILDMQL